MNLSISHLFVLSAALLLCANTVSAAKLYKWVDKDGKVSYQDSPPPKGTNVVTQEEFDTSASTNNTPPPRQNAPVLVYTTKNCPSCVSLLEKIKNWGITAEEQSLLDRDVQAKILELTDSLFSPTLFIGDKLIQDLSEASISEELKAAGYELKTASEPAQPQEQEDEDDFFQ